MCFVYLQNICLEHSTQQQIFGKSQSRYAQTCMSPYKGPITIA